MTTYSISRHKMRVLFFVLLVSAFILPLSSADTDVVREADADGPILANHIIVIDNSGAINSNNHQRLVHCVSEYVQQTYNSTQSGYINRYTVITYNQNATVRCNQSSLLQEVLTVIGGLPSPSGASSPSRALKMADTIASNLSARDGVTNVILFCDVMDLANETAGNGTDYPSGNTNYNCRNWISHMVTADSVNVRVVSIGQLNSSSAA